MNDAEIKNGSTRWLWWQEVVLSIIVHPAAVIGAFVLGILIGGGSANLVGNAQLSRFADRVLFANPFYPLLLVTGLACGFFANYRLRSRSAIFIWVLFSIPIWWDIWAYKDLHYEGFRGALNYLFSPNCSNCTEQFFTVGLVVTSIAYSVGAGLGFRLAARRGRQDISERGVATSITVPGTDSPGRLVWWTEGVLFVFVHTLVGVLGVTFFSFPARAVSRIVFGYWFMVHAFGPPAYIGQVAIACVTGLVINRRLQSKSALFTWIVGIVWMLLDVLARMHLLHGATWHFSEDPIYVPAPTLVSIGYSLGAWFAYRRMGANRSPSPRPLENVRTSIS